MIAGCFTESDIRDQTKTTSFFHSGDLGDIIYSLLFARTMSPIELFIGPDPAWKLREQMSPERFEWFAPLLRRQPWIKRVEFSDRVKVDYNLNDFRRTWFSPHSGCSKRRRLFETYAEHFGKPALQEDVAWIEVERFIDRNHPVVISRSPRYRNNAFPWQKISNHYAGRMLFVGLIEEYEDWTAAFGKTAEFKPVRNALELATVIAGAQLFIGNQSFPMALALACKVPIIQETFPFTPDCVFRRPHAIYTHHSQKFDLPDVKGGEMRLARNKVNVAGKIEIGPCADAYGLGDTISVLPVARALGDRAIMLMPREMERYSFLFYGMCPTQITDNFPVFPFTSDGSVFASKLKVFGLVGAEEYPRLNFRNESLEQASAILKPFKNPIIFNPTCSRHWSHVRQRPPTFWKTIVPKLAERYTVLQTGWDDYPLVEGAVRCPFVPLEILSTIHRIVGKYVGVHTGDHHLMMAAQGMAVVVEPDPVPEFHAGVWSYQLPHRIQYAKLSHPQTVLDAIERLGL